MKEWRFRGTQQLYSATRGRGRDVGDRGNEGGTQGTQHSFDTTIPQ